MKRLFLHLVIFGIMLLMAGAVLAAPVSAPPHYYSKLIFKAVENTPGLTNFLDSNGNRVGYAQATASGRVDFFNNSGQHLGYSLTAESGKVDYYDKDGKLIGTK